MPSQQPLSWDLGASTSVIIYPSQVSERVKTTFTVQLWMGGSVSLIGWICGTHHLTPLC
jgi:hypothetical protein